MIQTMDLYLPTGPASAAFEALYDGLLRNMASIRQIDTPEGSIRPAVFRLGDLRFALSAGTPNAAITLPVLYQLMLIMRERARRGLGSGWRGVLLNSNGHVWVAAVGASVAWLGWPEILGSD